MNENPSSKSVRVFLALWPDDDVRAALAAWQVTLQVLCGGRETPAMNLHNTLIFLGVVKTERLEALNLAVEEVRGKSFQLIFDIARYWGHNHIIYAAPSVVPEQLLQLESGLESSLRKHHFNFDKRSYKPHITLQRHAHWTDTPLPTMPAISCGFHDFVLVQSVSAAQGVRYEVLSRFQLNSGKSSSFLGMD